MTRSRASCTLAAASIFLLHGLALGASPETETPSWPSRYTANVNLSGFFAGLQTAQAWFDTEAQCERFDFIDGNDRVSYVYHYEESKEYSVEAYAGDRCLWMPIVGLPTIPLSPLPLDKATL